MYETISIMPGVTLHYVRAERFKQGCLSVQFLRPMCMEEAALNLLLPAVLMRGTAKRPNMRLITQHQDDLYGSSFLEVCRRTGDYQGVGFLLRFLEDRFAMDGDQILDPMLDFLEEVLLDPMVEDGGFNPEFVSSEKKNLLQSIDSLINDKRSYANAKMMEKMCSADTHGIPRYGSRENVEAVDPVQLYNHFQKVLSESPVVLFYVGSADPQAVAQKLTSIFAKIPRNPVTLPEQTAFRDGGGGTYTETADITQGKLVVGYVTPITIYDDRFPAMQLFNFIFGGDMTSKLFTSLREQQSLCYYILCGYYGAKGLVVLDAGIDCDQYDQAMREQRYQLELCCNGGITESELVAAKKAVISSLIGIYDSPGSIESFETGKIIAGTEYQVDDMVQRIEAVTLEQVIEAARTLRPHTTFFLKGVSA